MSRPYRLGKRQPSVDATARSISTAARQLLQEMPSEEVSVAAIARRAGVSRITVYNRFGSRHALLDSLAPVTPAEAETEGDPRTALRRHLEAACSRWAADPPLFRHLSFAPAQGDAPRLLSERLAAADELRPGCSLREAEDVIGALGSFAVFDRLHRDGRRPAGAVAEVLMRLAAGILA